MAQFCEACKQLQFLDVCCPTASDIRKARKAKNENKSYSNFAPFRFFSSEYARVPSDIPLGPLGRIRGRSGHCDLCRLVYGAIKRRGTFILGNKPFDEDNDNIIILAGMSGLHGFITESLLDAPANSCPDRLFKVRRLGLKMEFERDTVVDGTLIRTGNTLAVHSQIAQVCHVGEFTEAPHVHVAKDASISKSDPPSMLFGGRKLPSLVDKNLLSHWVSICEAEHGMSCGVYDEELVSDVHTFRSKLIRLIHVDDNCLHVLQDVDLASIRYAALSYVWGGPQQVKLEKDNEDQLQLPGAFSKTNLPQTISDAIHLARLVDIKYLWVDALCIFQGGSPIDIEDRKYQLSNMGNIYRGALVTIMAACGANSKSGLSGLRPGSRTFKQEVVQLVPLDDDSEYAGLGLVSTCTSDSSANGQADWVSQNAHYINDDIDTGAWNTRAWTFQERCLARRCLIFTPEQVFWVCDGAFFCEESHFEHPRLYEKREFDTPLRVELANASFKPLSWKSIDGPLARMTTNRKDFWVNYALIVAEYSRRELTCPGDVYDAFQSIGEAFGRISGETFHWGHPRSRFGLALAWKSKSQFHSLRRRKAKTTLSMTSLNVQVHLPSWSWMGWVGEITLGVQDSRMEYETSEISCFEHQNCPCRIIEVRGANRFDMQDFSQAPAKGWSVDRNLPWRDSKVDVVWDDIREYWPDLTDTRLQTIPEGHMLFFWASSAYFNIERPKNIEMDREMLYWKNSNQPDEPKVTSAQGTLVGTLDKMDKEHWEHSPTTWPLQEFVVIGRRAIPELPHIPAVVLALQIRWEDGIAYRVNIAEIDEAAWIEAAPKWKLIALM